MVLGRCEYVGIYGLVGFCWFVFVFDRFDLVGLVLVGLDVVGLCWLFGRIDWVGVWFGWI